MTVFGRDRHLWVSRGSWRHCHGIARFMGAIEHVRTTRTTRFVSGRELWDTCRGMPEEGSMSKATMSWMGCKQGWKRERRFSVTTQKLEWESMCSVPCRGDPRTQCVTAVASELSGMTFEGPAKILGHLRKRHQLSRLLVSAQF